MHEHTPHSSAPVEGSSDRSFGLVFAAFFLIVALYPLWHGAGARIWAVAASGVFLILALVAPVVLAPLNRVWTKFGTLLHSIISPVALGILFYLVITPTGMLMRLLGKDPLRLRFDPSAESYWIKRSPPGPNADSLNNQF